MDLTGLDTLPKAQPTLKEWKKQFSADEWDVIKDALLTKEALAVENFFKSQNTWPFSDRKIYDLRDKVKRGDL